MAMQVVSATFTALAPQISSSASQSQEERLFCVPDCRHGYGLNCRSEHVHVMKGAESLRVAKMVNVKTMLESSKIREGSFSQSAALSKRHIYDAAYVENHILRTGSLVRQRELNSGNDVIFQVPRKYIASSPKSMSSGCETAKLYAVGILTFASEMLLEDSYPFVFSAFADTISDGSSIPSDAPSAENLQPTTDAVPNNVDSSISIGDAVVNIPSVNEQEVKIPSESSFSLESLPSTESNVDSLLDTVSKTSETTSESLSEMKKNTDFSVDGAQKSLEEFFSSVQGSLDYYLNSANNAVKETYMDINELFLKSTKSLTESFENTISGLFPVFHNSEGLTNSSAVDFISPFRMGTPANNAIKKVVLVLKDSARALFITTADFVTEVYTSTKTFLPPEAQTFLDSSEKIASSFIQPLESFIQQANRLITEAEKALGVDPENPIIPVILVTGGTVFVGISYWAYMYGGYSGDLIPKQALDLLRKEANTVLIDIRPQELKESDGIPDLRRGERFKFAPVEFPKVEDAIRKLLKNANEIDDVLMAAVIRNLKIVNGGSKVLILDANGSQSKRVARTLRKLGVKRSYRIKGGFQSWVADGLRVKEMAMETPLTILKEDTEVILEEMRPTPGVIFAAFVGIVAGINAIIEWEKTLQLIGFIGLAQTIYRRTSSYETSEDLKADIRALLSPFRWASQSVLWISGRIQPNKFELATSPSTTAVQNRVLQAAAKHGSLSSELEESQDEEPTSDSAITNDKVNVTTQGEIEL